MDVRRIYFVQAKFASVLGKLGGNSNLLIKFTRVILKGYFI